MPGSHPIPACPSFLTESLLAVTQTLMRCSTDMAAIVKGSKVRIKRKYSYWYNEIGVVASREKEPTKSRYPITVRFEKCNYYGLQGVDGGNTTNNFSEEELELVMS